MRRGHAIEVSINAEEPVRDFMPSPGKLSTIEVTSREWLCFDAGFEEGGTVPPHYNSLVGKLIVHGATRPEALARMAEVMDETRFAAIHATIALYRALCGASRHSGGKGGYTMALHVASHVGAENRPGAAEKPFLYSMLPCVFPCPEAQADWSQSGSSGIDYCIMYAML